MSTDQCQTDVNAQEKNIVNENKTIKVEGNDTCHSFSGANGILSNTETGSVRAVEDKPAKFTYTLYDGLTLTIPTPCTGRSTQEKHPSKVFRFNLLLYALGAIIAALVWFIVWCALPTKNDDDDSFYNDQLALPGGLLFDVFIAVMVNAFIGVILCENILGIPVVVGVLWSAIAYNHIPSYGYLTTGINPKVRNLIGQCGLSIILARAGFSISWKLIRKNVINVVALSVVPQIVEGVVHGVMAYYMFSDEFSPAVSGATDESWKWAMLQGFLGSVISTGIVAPGMLHLLHEGYTCAPTPIVLSAVGIDTALGVWAVTFILSLFDDYTGGRSIVLSILLGPIQLIAGCVIGALMGYGFVCLSKILRRMLVHEEHDEDSESAQSEEPAVYLEENEDSSDADDNNANNEPTNGDNGGGVSTVSAAVEEAVTANSTVKLVINHIMPDTNYFDRVLLFLFLAISLSSVLLGKKIGLSGGGTMLTLTFAATVSHFLELEIGHRPHDKYAHTKKTLASNLAFIWNYIMVGAVFTMTGVAVPLTNIFSASFFPKCIACIGVSSVFRIIASAVSVLGAGCNAKEIGFVTMAWFGKAAVQASMNGIAVDRAIDNLNTVTARHAHEPIPSSSSPILVAQQQLTAAVTVQQTAILYIMLSAPICAIFISKFGPVFLRKGSH